MKTLTVHKAYLFTDEQGGQIDWDYCPEQEDLQVEEVLMFRVDGVDSVNIVDKDGFERLAISNSLQVTKQPILTMKTTNIDRATELLHSRSMIKRLFK